GYHVMVAAPFHNSSVAHLQTRDEVQTAIGIPNDEIWQVFLNNTDTLANDLDQVWIDLGNLLKAQAAAAR
ncbi:MAG: hypothetical protein MK003_14280, partial [Pseudomonadales bacterium]|nr:hypothetical protein [Pseudomonadales bacterium]